ncbi:P2X purinoceptor 7-like [Lineus longissimus]|uniref:P2X purinoceptor 7-like n=1 Tax=Lineus longissimus TaxID=88925 RepID=UPI002B4E5075
MADFSSSEEEFADNFSALSCEVEAIEGYRFEPIRRETHPDSSDDEENSGEEESSEDERPERAGHNRWCDCGKICQPQTKGRVSMCCSDYSAVQGKKDALEPDGCECITAHPGFTVNCLNQYALELAMNRYINEEGPVGNDQPTHKLYRYLAYRSLVEWCFGKLGKKNRLPLPVCARDRIRENWPEPDGVYTGFSYQNRARTSPAAIVVVIGLLIFIFS